MKRTSKLVLAGLAAFVLPVLSHAASVTWGSVQAITGASDILSTGVTSLAGANFGITTGTATIVNNGAVDIEFKSLRSGQNATLSNGITVAADSTWGNWGLAGGNSAVTGNFGTVLDSNLGIEDGGPTSASITLSGLTIGTQYQIQFFADSTGNNSQTISGSAAMNTLSGQFVTGTFTADATSQVLTMTRNTDFGVANALTIGALAVADTTPPEWAATWPQAASLSSTSLTVRAKTNEAGSAYYVVLPDGAPAPSSAQVKAGTDSGDTPVSASGSMVLTANTEATATVNGLSPGTAYDVYFIAEDGVPNLRAFPTMVDVTTQAPDITPPEWIATWPQADPLSPTSLTVRAKTNEAGNAYYVVLPDGAPAPSAAQVAVGTDSANTPVAASGRMPLTANTQAAATVDGLSTNTAYDVYFVAEDTVPILQAFPTMVNVTTLAPDITPPAWIATWPKAEQLSATSVTVRAQTNETCAAYYVVLAAGATAPSATQVKVGNDSADAPALKSGTFPLTANTEATAPVTGLTADTTYDIYFVAEDAVPNLQATPSLVSVSLLPPAVTWGAWTSVTDNTAIQTLGGYTTYGGVNFNGATTTINNGSTDVTFTGIAQNASGTAAGITVGTSGFNFQSPSNNNSNVVSAVGSPQTWATVLDRVIGDFDNSATIDLTGLTAGSSYYVQFFSSAPDANILTNSKIASGGVDSPFFGTHAGGGTKSIMASFTANSTSQSFAVFGSEPTYSALVIGVQPAGGGNTYANWIGGFSGLNGLTGFNDDADADGLDNGVENFLGTAPNVGNAGLKAGALSGNTFTFTHPQNATPASDVSAPAYTWSTDLQTFHASGATSGGITVNLLATPNIPSPGTTTVTATVTGTTPSKLFVRLGVSQE